jgi:hypothetical protein
MVNPQVRRINEDPVCETQLAQVVEALQGAGVQEVQLARQQPLITVKRRADPFEAYWWSVRPGVRHGVPSPAEFGRILTKRKPKING